MSDPFATLGLAPSFSLDQAELEARYHELSKVVHPDRQAGKSPAERRRALSLAVDVNAAYRALRDPIRRAEAMLARSGRSGQEAAPSPAFLMEVMELREELADARRLRDLPRVQAMSEAARARRDRVTRELAALFDAGRDADAVPLVAELRYLARFLDEVRAIEEETGV